MLKHKSVIPAKAGMTGLWDSSWWVVSLFAATYLTDQGGNKRQASCNDLSRAR